MREKIPKIRNRALNYDLEVVVAAAESVVISRYFILCVVLNVDPTYRGLMIAQPCSLK